MYVNMYIVYIYIYKCIHEFINVCCTYNDEKYM